MDNNYTDEDPRYWVIDSDPAIGHPANKYGLVDEEAGGIVAWFDTYEQADASAKALNACLY